jgi:hypothetical protein
MTSCTDPLPVQAARLQVSITLLCECRSEAVHDQRPCQDAQCDMCTFCCAASLTRNCTGAVPRKVLLRSVALRNSMPRIRKRSKGGWLAADAAAAACTRCWQKNSISGVIALEWNDDLLQGMCRGCCACRITPGRGNMHRLHYMCGINTAQTSCITMRCDHVRNLRHSE